MSARAYSKNYLEILPSLLDQIVGNSVSSLVLRNPPVENATLVEEDFKQNLTCGINFLPHNTGEYHMKVERTQVGYIDLGSKLTPKKRFV